MVKMGIHIQNVAFLGLAACCGLNVFPEVPKLDTFIAKATVLAGGTPKVTGTQLS